MTKTLSGAAILAALLMSGVSTIAFISPAAAQDQYDDASFDSFHDQLAQYGDWIYSDRWGEVWIPDTNDNFSPYNSNGYWAYTNDYGWTWVSGYEWGDIPFHYGRWVNDPDDGWLWVPGYIWSPAWVAWRSSGSYIGWMALPPDDAFLGGEQYADNSVHIGIDFNDVNGFYGYGRWYHGYDDRRFASNWVFVNPGHMGDRQFHRFAAPASANILIVRNTRNITNYAIVNNFVVNRSVNVEVINHAGGHVRPVQNNTVVRNHALITSFTAGRATQVRVRALNPHGTGVPFSAPKPSDQIARSLSTRVPPKLAGRGAAHLFTRDTITRAPLPPKRGALSTTGAPSPAVAVPDHRVRPEGGPAMTPSGAPGAPERHGREPNLAIPTPPGPVAAPAGASPGHRDRSPDLTSPTTGTGPSQPTDDLPRGSGQHGNHLRSLDSSAPVQTAPGSTPPNPDAPPGHHPRELEPTVPAPGGTQPDNTMSPGTDRGRLPRDRVIPAEPTTQPIAPHASELPPNSNLHQPTGRDLNRDVPRTNASPPLGEPHHERVPPDQSKPTTDHPEHHDRDKDDPKKPGDDGQEQ